LEKVFLKKDGRIPFTQRAVMNAVYVALLCQPQPQDKSFECSIWKNWNSDKEIQQEYQQQTRYGNDGFHNGPG
jgi:hypothetical protein